jgi:hypothetical protein
VLDGVLGEIDLYNAANELVGQWKPSQFGIFAGAPNAGQSIVIKPNAADDFSRPAIEYRATVAGNFAVTDSTDDGVGRANLNSFGAAYANVSGVTVTTTLQLHTGFAGLLILGTDNKLRGGQFAAQDGSATVACYQTQSASPVVLSTVACNNLATPQVLITPDNTQTAQQTITAQWFATPGVAALVLDTAWQAIPLVGGWTGDATRVPLMRLMPDGTVQMKGLITKVANPVNGESWASAMGVKYRPQHTWTFLTATPGRAANTGQVVEIRANGTGVIFDMAALSGIIALDSVRYATI